MASIEMTFFSRSLQKNTDLTIIFPFPYEKDQDNYDDYFQKRIPYKVLYLLHGTYGNHKDWLHYSNIEKYIKDTNIMVVCPSGDNSFYQDMENGPNYFTYLTEELPYFIETLFPVGRSREERYIGGLSMGAMGAINCAMRKIDYYEAAICLSGGLMLKEISTNFNGDCPWPWKAILPAPYDGTHTGIDDERFIAQAKNSGEKPRLYLAVGKQDFIYSSVQQTRHILNKYGIKYTYEEDIGEHNWFFWDKYIQRAITWLIEGVARNINNFYD